ncbi:MAG: HAD-IA family hydrolase [Gammaproteobacteria bacterium]|jgi:HAD superfamily hydrolase (TIGR01509 family)
MLNAIIFDMDGTLADTEEIHRQAFNAAFAEFHIDCQWDPEEYRRLLSVSGGKERIRAYLLDHHLVDLPRKEIIRLASTIHKRKSEIYRDKLVRGRIKLRPGVARLIRSAVAEGVKLGIATSSSIKNVEALLKNTMGPEALDLFDCIVTCEIVADKKPSPAVYQFALAELGLSPAHCLAIEDTRNGNQAALAAGLKTVITTHAFTTDDNFDGAQLVVDQLGEPDQPFRVIVGDSRGYRFASIDLLRELLDGDDDGRECWEGSEIIAAE